MPLPDKRKHAQKQYFAFIRNENSIYRKPILSTGVYSTSTAELAVYKLILAPSIGYLFFISLGRCHSTRSRNERFVRRSVIMTLAGPTAVNERIFDQGGAAYEWLK